MFRVIRRSLILPAAICLLTACASRPVDPASLILGAWETNVGGLTVVTTYTESDVQVQGYNAVPYTLEAGRLVLGGDETTARTVSFDDAGDMLQTDSLTGSVHRFVRASL